MLWGISWLNAQIILADAARISDPDDKDEDQDQNNGKVEHRELKTKEDIKNYIKGLM